MPKLYLGPGLSQRVHQALSRRLESFMASASTAAEFPMNENPPMGGQAAGMEAESEKGDHATPHHEEATKSPTERDDKEEDRSRSPRLRIVEPDPNNPAEILASCTTLAIGVTSMIGALKNSSEKLEILINNSQTLQQDLCRSLETVASAVTNMSRAVESLTAGVSYNTGRVGAVCGEYQKLRKHLEWALDKPTSEVLKGNAKIKSERGQALKDLMDQLFESMNLLQENLQKIASRLEQAPVSHEKAMDYGPPLPPTGQVGTPSMTPMTPAPTMNMGTTGILPPPSAPPSVPQTIMPPPMAPPMAPQQPTLPIATFAGYSPAKMGEQPMTYPAKLEVQSVKSPPCQVIDESTGRIRCVSPTSRHDPATGTAAFAPLGYVVIKNTNDYRRVYP